MIEKSTDDINKKIKEQNKILSKTEKLTDNMLKSALKYSIENIKKRGK